MEQQPRESARQRHAPPARSQVAPDIKARGSLRPRVRQVAEAISSFLRGSETVFLETAQQLMGLEQRALGLVRGSAGAVEAGESPAASLERELEAVHGHLDESRGATRAASERLGSLVGQIKAFSVEGHAFEELASSLRVLGVLTRIESARGGHRLDTVADDVRRLSAQLESTFDGVLDRAAALGETASRARANSEAFLSHQARRSRDLLAGAKNSIEQLEALASAAAELSGRAGDTSEGVVREVRSVLVLLQTHDTTRQMIEHVVTELEELDGDRGLDEAGFRAELAGLSELEAKQLGFAREQLTKAVLDMGVGLRAVGAAVGVLADETRQLAGHREGDSLLASVERCVSDTARLLREQLTLEQDIDVAMAEVARTVKTMVGSVTDLESIGVAVKLLALNGIVQTAHVGTDRAVFAALAGQMGEVAKAVALRSSAVTQRLKAVDLEAHGLQDSGLSTQVAKCGVLVTNLDTLLEKIAGYHKAVSGRVDGLLLGSAALSAEVQRLAQRLDREATQLMTLKALEAEILALGRQSAADGGAIRPSRRLEAAKARYTMEAERAVHRDVAGSVEAAPGKAGEPAAGEFGANVELF